MLTKSISDSRWAVITVASTTCVAAKPSSCYRICRPTASDCFGLLRRCCFLAAAAVSMASSAIVQMVADILVIICVTAFMLLSFWYCYIMWNIRHDFLIAMRSPLLSCWCGAILAFRTWSCTMEFVVAWGGRAPTDDGIIDLIGLPMILAAEGMAIMRAVRVFLMYYPAKRKKWGSIPKEKATVRALLWAFVLMEIIVWSGAAACGIPRAGGVTSSTLAPFAVLTSLGAALWLGCQLGRVDDMCGIGRGCLFIGWFMVGSGLMYAAILVVPMSTAAFKYAHVTFAIISYTPIVWTLNIGPVRETLKNKQSSAHSEAREFCLLCGIVPWRQATQTARIAVAPQRSMRHLVSSQSSSAFDNFSSPLEDIIMSFAPLKEAFGEFCRKALCKESFDFLVAVSDFKHSVSATHAVDRDKQQGVVGKDYDNYLAIVREYVESGACSEVNIDSHARHEALMYTDKDDYMTLSLDERAEIFFLAQREVSQLLAENLLRKFRSSAPYKELVHDEALQEG